MKYRSGIAHLAGEGGRLACPSRRLAAMLSKLKSSQRRGRRCRQAGRLPSPELPSAYRPVCSLRTMLAAMLSVVLSGLTGQLNAKEDTPPTASPAPSNHAVDQLIPWLLDEGKELRGIPFSEVIFDTTGKRVLPIDLKNEIDARVIKQISAALDETMKSLNSPKNPVQQAERINEVSSHVEDTLRALLSATPGLSCDFPHTAANKVQRSGYPDLRIVDVASNRVFYLDPKLYAAGSRESSFRTFYFEPKIATNKVRDDAVHLIAGLEHSSRKDGEWRFSRWDLVDLSRFQVKLKAEFQGSNKDMYRPEAIVASSAK